MKHIRAKLLDLHQLTDEEAKAVINIPYYKQIEVGSPDELTAYLFTTQGYRVLGFKYVNDGKLFVIPEPNLTVAYFSTAQMYLQPMLKEREKLMTRLQNSGHDLLEINHAFSTFFGLSSSIVISLFNALEAFVNALVPDDFEYQKEEDVGVQTYDRDKILRNLNFEEKIKKVIPQITHKAFHQQQGHVFVHIKALKKYRDNVVHAKKSTRSSPNFFEHLYVASLSFNYSATFLAVQAFINFYEPNLIEICNCGSDH